MSQIETAESRADDPRDKPDDLEAADSQRWDQHCCELDDALDHGDAARTRRALAMLERLRYGWR